MSLGISEQCNVSFASFWDLGPRVDPGDDATEAAMLALADRALAFAAEGRLFNADATATLLVASVSACGGTPVTMRCASDPNGYCAPILKLSQRLKDYAARANGQATGLRLQVLPPVDSAVSVVDLAPTLTLTQVVDFGDINESIKTGIDQTMALSTLSMPLALAVLGFMLRNVRPLPSSPSLPSVLSLPSMPSALGPLGYMSTRAPGCHLLCPGAATAGAAAVHPLHARSGGAHHVPRIARYDGQRAGALAHGRLRPLTLTPTPILILILTLTVPPILSPTLTLTLTLTLTRWPPPSR